MEDPKYTRGVSEIGAPLLTEDKMNKQQLLETLRAVRQSHDSMYAELQKKDENFKGLTEYTNKLQEDFQRVTETAETVIQALNTHHKRRQQAVFGILDNMKVLFEEPDFSPKQGGTK